MQYLATSMFFSPFFNPTNANSYRLTQLPCEGTVLGSSLNGKCTHSYLACKRMAKYLKHETPTVLLR